MQLVIRAPTLADALWLGSSLDWSAPTPRLGSWVWKTDMRPPVGDSSLKAACRAEPRADWVSMVFWNRFGRLFSRSCTSWKRNVGTGLFLRRFIDPCGKILVCHCSLLTEGDWSFILMQGDHTSGSCLFEQRNKTQRRVNKADVPTSLHSLRFTKRLSGVGKKISVENKKLLWNKYKPVIHIILTIRPILSCSYRDVCFLTFSRLVFILGIRLASGCWNTASGLCCQLHLTFDVRHDEHLRLRKSLLEVVEVDGAVEGDEAYLRPRVSRKSRTQTKT